MNYKTLLFKSDEILYLGFFDENKQKLIEFKPIKLNQQDDGIKNLKLNEFCLVLVDEVEQGLQINNLFVIPVDNISEISKMNIEDLFSVANDLINENNKIVLH